MLGVVDTYLMGNLADPAYLASLGIGAAIFNFVYWGFGFLRMGTTGFTSQAFGSRDRSEINALFYRGMLVALAIGLILLLTQVAIFNAGLFVIETNVHVAEQAGRYYYIRIWAAPANMLIMVISGWLLGMQNAVYPLIIAFASNLLNILLSVFFVKVWKMDIEGAALGTLIAQYTGLAVGLALLYIKYRDQLKLPSTQLIIQKEKLIRFFKVNGDIFIRTLCLIFAFMFFTAQSARLGEDILALNTLLLQLLAVISYGIDGFAFAAESITGRLIGEGNRKTLKKAVNLLFVWGFGVSIILSLWFWIAGEWTVSVFTHHRHIIELAGQFMVWIIIAPLVNSFSYIWDGIYIGATAGRPMRNSMFFATFIIYVPLFYLLSSWGGNHALWLAFTLFFIARGTSLTYLASKYVFSKAGM